MNKNQLDSLSSSLSKAINPAARKIEATAKILDHIEPLPVISKQTHDTEPPTPVQEREAQSESEQGRFSGTETTAVLVENTLANLTTVAKTESSPWPMATVVKTATLANLATNKDDDDLLNTNHHQSGNQPSFPQPPTIEPQEARVARRENGSLPDFHETPAVNTGSTSRGPAFDHLMQTITAYTTITRNPWLQTDTVSYLQNHIDQVPVEKIKGVIQTVFDRADSRINSFAYFVKEILATNNQRSVGARRKALAAIIRRVRESHTGLANYGIADLVFDVKNACEREGVIFDNDLFNAVMKDRA